jgi:hypothetical protein
MKGIKYRTKLTWNQMNTFTGNLADSIAIKINCNLLKFSMDLITSKLQNKYHKKAIE